MPTFELSQAAHDDLQAIWDFIADDNVEAANRVVTELVESFKQLAKWPGQGHVRRDLTSRDVRFWPVRSYLVIYQEQGDVVQIVAILHGARDIPAVIG